MEKMENMENMECKELAKVVAVAVRYWGNFLRDPLSFEMDNGEPSQHLMLNMLAKMGAKPVDEDKVKLFEENLGLFVFAELSKNGRIGLNVDYHPEGLLRKALDSSLGSGGYNSMNIFPCKTDMHITNEVVAVSQGYRAETKTLYPEV